MESDSNYPHSCGSGNKPCCDGVQLQKSFNSGLRNEDISWWRQQAWDEHRYFVERLLFTSKRQENILIVGAGNCDDFSLERVATKFKHVVLLDCDKASLEYAVKKIPSDLHSKISIVEFDVTGIYNTKIASLLRKLKDNSLNNLEEELSAIREDLIPATLPDELLSMAFDMVAFLALFTQLFMPLFDTEISTKSIVSDAILEEARKLASSLSNITFKTFLPIMQKGTQVAFYTDFLEFEELTSQIEKSLRNIQVAFSEDFFDYRIAGALDALLAAEELFGFTSIYIDTWYWPFFPTRIYYVVGSTVTID